MSLGIIEGCQPGTHAEILLQPYLPTCCTSAQVSKRLTPDRVKALALQAQRTKTLSIELGNEQDLTV